MIEASYENRSCGNNIIPPNHSATISYDEGSVMIYVHNGERDNTDDHSILHVNIDVIGAVTKYKGWKIEEIHKSGDNLYLKLFRDPTAKC